MTVPAPAVSILSNGRYSVLVTQSGSGYSAWQEFDVTRWREDVTRDCWGQFVYVRDVATGKVWSVGRQPIVEPLGGYDYEFHGEKAEFRRRVDDIETIVSVCVDPHRDAELRSLTVVNHGKRPRELELTSYAEVCLNHRRADQAHPAFAKLFLETRFDKTTGALFARRRPRAASEKPIWAVHVSSSSEASGPPIGHETDRLRFLGRGRTASNPRALDPRTILSNSSGPVLDPVFSLRRNLHLEPGAMARVAFATGAADDPAKARAIAKHFSDIEAVDRAFLEAFEACQKELNDSALTPDRVSLFNRLIEAVVFADPRLRDAIAAGENRLGQSGLWPYAISGDLPIVLVRDLSGSDETLVREVLDWQSFSRRRGLRFDLVLVSEGNDIAAALTENLNAGETAELFAKPGGIFVLSEAEVAKDHMTLLAAAARIVLEGRKGALAEQAGPLAHRVAGQASAGRSQGPRPRGTSSRHDEAALQFWNGFGGFADGGREYAIVVDGAGRDRLPPAPWTNVIANRQGGCLATEAGLGYTWSGNSQMNRLTPWSNDPVSDPPSEIVYLRDEDAGEVWTPTPLPMGRPTSTLVSHGQGYTRYVSRHLGLAQEMSVHVPPEGSIKLVTLELRNEEDRERRLTAWYFAEWVLGTLRDNAAMQVVCERDAESGAIVARNSWAGAFAGRLAFAAASGPVRSATGDRSEFLGRDGSPSDPAGPRRDSLGERFGPLLDPCAALMVEIVLPPGGSSEVVFGLGQADDIEQARQLVREHVAPAHSRQSLAATAQQWNDILGTIQVSTPDAGFNIMMNRWLIYQILACRLWARTSNYQSGGAYGFRDQLQDAMALVYSAPDEARAQILRSAARQFEEGDVQHWWHPPSGLGVRTRITDDLYFLPFVVDHYVSTTGDISLLDERVSFIHAPVLRKDQEEDFGQPEVSREAGSVYEHCVRALKHGLRLGKHGLPLMGTGDWNDGMNKVGAGGKGESVWNGWFFLTVLKSFATLAARRGDQSRARWCREKAEALRAALEANAWDGAWYRRAYFDDGTPLGSALNEECQIDAIPQAWAVISGEADKERTAAAMEAVQNRLVREQDRLIKLFDPPFDNGSLQPGYIKGYVPGIRENGGQYTHAAVWVVWATALQGDGDRALQLWNFVNPIYHAATAEQAELYKTEPYVVCADIYGAPPHTGRGGWSWYTGSASWLYRVGLEAILGFRLRGKSLEFAPCLPTSWKDCAVTYRRGATTYEIRFDNSRGGAVRSVALDGNPLADGIVPLVDDGKSHRVDVKLG